MKDLRDQMYGDAIIAAREGKYEDDGEGLLPYVFESPSELKVEDMNSPEQLDMAILMVEGQIKDKSSKIESTDKEIIVLTEKEENLREGLRQALEER